MLVQNIFSKSTYLCSIKNDDKMIQTEGVESLSEEELRQACRERGHLGLLSTEEMRQQVCCIMICTWSHVVWSRINFFFSCPFIFLIPLCWPFLLQLFESSIFVLQYSHSSFWAIFNTLTLLVSLILTFQASQPRINLGLLTQSHLELEWLWNEVFIYVDLGFVSSKNTIFWCWTPIVCSVPCLLLLLAIFFFFSRFFYFIY